MKYNTWNININEERGTAKQTREERGAEPPKVDPATGLATQTAEEWTRVVGREKMSESYG